MKQLPKYDLNKCWNCKYQWQKIGLCDNERYDFCERCRKSKYTNYIYDNNKPLYHIDIAQQLIFDCIMELQYGYEKLDNKEIANKLHGILLEMDKMNLEENI